MEPTDDFTWVKVLGLISLFALIAFAVWLASRSSKKREEDERAKVEKAVSEGIEQGILNKYGEPMCVICGQVATRYGVVTGRSWFDKLPIVSRLNTLYSMPWRYKVEDDYERGHRLCTLHRKAAERRLDQLHAQMRSEHAQFNASLQQKVELMDQGGLDQLLREDTEEIKRSIGFKGVVRRSVEARFGEHEVHVLPAATTDRRDPA